MLVLTRSRGKGVVISHNGSIYDLMLIQVYHSHKIKLKITKRNEDIKKNTTKVYTVKKAQCKKKFFIFILKNMRSAYKIYTLR